MRVWPVLLLNITRRTCPPAVASLRKTPRKQAILGGSVNRREDRLLTEKPRLGNFFAIGHCVGENRL